MRLILVTDFTNKRNQLVPDLPATLCNLRQTPQVNSRQENASSHEPGVTGALLRCAGSGGVGEVAVCAEVQYNDKKNNNKEYMYIYVIHYMYTIDGL